MTTGPTRAATRVSSAGLAALISVLLASCSSTTGGSPLETGQASFAGQTEVAAAASSMGPTAALMTDVAAETSGATTTDAGKAAADTTGVSPAEGGELPAAIVAKPATRPNVSPATADRVPTQVAEDSPTQTAAKEDTAASPDVAPETQQAEAPQPAATEPSTKPTQLASAAPTRQYASAAAPIGKKKGFLAAFFGQPAEKPAAAAIEAQASDTAPQDAEAKPPQAAPAAAPKVKPLIEDDPEAKPIITLASTGATRKSANLASLGGDEGEGSGLPGVRQSALFEIKRKSGMDDDSDVDLHEDEDAPVQLASAGGFARLAPNGLLKQRESVDTACLKPSLVRMLKSVERHFGKKMIVTSGYRSPTYNRKVNGARRSMHMYCAAADVQVPGVNKWELARYVRTMSGRGGVGTYCHTESVHIDVGPERDWNWRCRRRRA